MNGGQLIPLWPGGAGKGSAMYSQIYVPVDNSEHSNQAVEISVALAQAFQGKCIGSHVYAARMHDYRFKQMEYTLPDEYQDEAELLRQRRIHDSLITTGLQLISDSYTDVMHYRCLEAKVPFEARKIDGRNWEELVTDINDNQYDLVVMGAMGMGAVKESRLGSVTDRVVRRIRTDTLVVRSVGNDAMAGDILVAIDGSPQSFAGLQAAIAIGKALGKKVEAVAVYDPYLHYAVFNSIVDVLSEKASKVFRFKEQEALHEEIIDTGLAKIYESHLKVARATAADAGVELPITLLDGKAFEQVLRHARDVKPWLLVCGRIGVHSDAAMDIGSNADQLLRLAPCNVLLTSGTYVPPIDMRADAAINWTPEAEERMGKVPAAARGIARTAVLRWAIERGHSVVSSGDVEVALEELMPYSKGMKRIAMVAATLEEAELAMATEAPVAQARAVCRTCGYAARAAIPVECPVCGGEGDNFEPIDAVLLATTAAGEGDASETGFDGRKLGWTMEARELLHQIPAGYLRRRVKAIIEKAARTRNLPAITREVTEPYVMPELEALDGNAGPHRAPVSASDGVRSGGGTVEGRLAWTSEAESRLERIPEGFLRSLAREEIERLAITVASGEVTVLHVEAGIAEVKARMQGSMGAAVPAKMGSTADATPGCPVHTGSGTASKEREKDGATPHTGSVSAGSGSSCPVTGHGGAEAHHQGNPVKEPVHLNEVTEAVVESLGKRVTFGDAWVGEQSLEWTAEAQELLNLVPDFCRDMVRRSVEWTAIGMQAGTVLPEMVMHSVTSASPEKTMEWTGALEAELAAIPDEFRGMVVAAAEERARSLGQSVVTTLPLENGEPGKA